MTIAQRYYARKIINKTAKQMGITPAQCRADMTHAIQEAWSTTDPIVKQRQIELVGDSHIPTPEEFIFLSRRCL